MQKFQNVMFYVQKCLMFQIVDYPKEDSINRVESLENKNLYLKILILTYSQK
jgi:hypothetical protein